MGKLAGRPRQAMFPSLVWRAAYDHLNRHHDVSVADERYLEILQPAATKGLSTVENVVEQLLSAPKPVVNAREVTALMLTIEDEAMAFREREALPASLEAYDDLLNGTETKR